MYAEGRLVMQRQHVEGEVQDRLVVTEAQGSIGAVLQADGELLKAFFYDPYGKRTNLDGSPVSMQDDARAGFTGHDHDEDLDLINMRGRVYDPTLRKFLTADPIAGPVQAAVALDPFAYVHHDPVNRIDPSGFQDVPDFRIPSDESDQGMDEPPPPDDGPEGDSMEVLAESPPRPAPHQFNFGSSAGDEEADVPYEVLDDGTGGGSSLDPSRGRPQPVTRTLLGNSKPRNGGAASSGGYFIKGTDPGDVLLSELSSLATWAGFGGEGGLLAAAPLTLLSIGGLAGSAPLGGAFIGLSMFYLGGRVALEQGIAEKSLSGFVDGALMALSGVGMVGPGIGSGPRAPAPAGGRKMVDPRSLRPTHRLDSRSKVNKLAKKIKKNGYDPAEPLDIAEVDGVFYIDDGHHRAAAAARAGKRQVPANVRQVTSDAEKRELFREWASTLDDKGF